MCRVFAEWSKQYIGGTTSWSTFTFRNGAEVRRAVECLPTKGLKVWLFRAHSVSIVGGANTKQIPHVASFASTFAGRWARIGTLFIEKALWPSSLQAADAAVFRNLSRFASLTHLALDDVTFPSIVAFGALVSALPGLKELQLCDVKFAESSFLFDSRTLSRSRLLPQAKNLKGIRLGAVVTDRRFRPAFTPTAWPCYTELLAFMTAVSRPYGSSPRVYPWGSVGRLQLEEYIWWKFSSFSIARLLRALPSLASLTFRCAEDRFKEMRITAGPAYPRLKPADIVVECGTSQSQHVADIVRSLIKMDYPLRITEIHASIYPSSRETDTVVTATNELVKHAAPSLEHLHLCLRFRTADLLGHYPYLRYP